MSSIDPEIGEKLKRSGAEFLSIDIETALNFARLARSEQEDSETKFRNQKNARNAYDKIQELLPRLHLSSEQQSKINEGLTQLRTEMKALGEHF